MSNSGSPSRKWPAVDCPLCPFPHLWRDTEKCPGCNDEPARGEGKISRFKVPGLYALYPELARVITQKEMPAVHPEDEKKYS